eukprot:GEMP01057519.1.p1 GENE.GEMP01057519.1~~GEMP01057519.1.p1  ORF type:complete len:458 (+),score=103.90 GEMP01057519.1:55-1374(+)
MDEETAALYLKRSLDDEWRHNFKEYDTVVKAFETARCGSHHATLLLKLMRNLCVRNPRAQSHWREEGSLDLAMASTRSGSEEFQIAALTFVYNMLAGEDSEENRAILAEFFPWAFVRWMVLDVDKGFMVLHAMAGHAEPLLREHPAFLHLFISLLAASSKDKESEWGSIFLASRPRFAEEVIRIIQRLNVPDAMEPLTQAPEDLQDKLAQRLSAPAAALRFLWCACDTLTLDLSCDILVATLDATLPIREINACPSDAPRDPVADTDSSASVDDAPSWWDEFLRVLIARTARGEHAELLMQAQSESLIRVLFTRGLPFMQSLLATRPRNPAEYVRLAKQWEVINLLRIIANCVAIRKGQEMLNDSGNIWMLLNHTFSDPDLPLLMEVGLFAVNNATRSHVPNQECVHRLTQVENGGPAHMPSQVRAALDQSAGGKLKAV